MHQQPLKQVLSLQWKEFNRGKSVGGKLVAKIFKWFWLIYFAFMSVMIGIIASAYGGPLMEFPLENNSLAPFEYVNGQLIYFFAYLIVMRYFIQSLPVLNIRSFLLTSILKKDIVRFSLLKTILTYFNILPLFFLVPFTLTLASSGNYTTLGLVGWNINLLGIIYLTNFFNFLLNNKNNLIYIVAAALGLIKALEYFSIIDFTIYSKEAFYLFYDIPYLSLFTWLFVFWLYSYVKKYFVTGLYIDTGLQVKIKEAKMDDFSWLNRFGKTELIIENAISLPLLSHIENYILINKNNHDYNINFFMYMYYRLGNLQESNVIDSLKRNYKTIKSYNTSFFPNDIRFNWNEDNFGPIIIPSKNKKIKLTQANLPRKG